MSGPARRNFKASLVLGCLLVGVALVPAAGLRAGHERELLLRSPAFEEKDLIPRRFTCRGEGLSPPLEIEGTPENAESLALLMYDADTARGARVHWVVFNLPPTTRQLSEGAMTSKLPEGSRPGRNHFGDAGYQPPCPREGRHRYVFELFALDEELALPAAADVGRVRAALRGRTLEKAKLIAMYEMR